VEVEVEAEVEVEVFAHWLSIESIANVIMVKTMLTTVL
jgi:hypothetical protein